MALRTKAVTNERKRTKRIRAALLAVAVVAALTYAVPAAATGNYGETREQAVERCGENAEPVWSEFGWQCVDVNAVWSEFMTDSNGKYLRGSTGRIVPLCSQKAIRSAQDRGYGVCHPTDSHLTSARFDARSQLWVRSTDPLPRPIRTINEGKSTTFTVPNPSASDRQTVTQCANFADERVEPAAVFRSDGTLVCDYSVAVEKRPGVTVSGNSISTFGPCRGPYTVEVLTRDSRVEHVGGRRIRVTTSTNDNLDDTGSLAVEYFLVGTSTRTFAQTHPGATVQTSTTECTLLRTTRVEVSPARRHGMSVAVSRHAPSNEWLDGTTTSNWTCTQVLLDYYATQEPPIPAPCSLNDIVSRTTKNEFPAPRGCKVLVTVAEIGKGFGSTGCLTSSQMAVVVAEIEAAHEGASSINVGSIPDCPLSTDPDKMNAIDTASDGRKRCMARN